MSNTTEPYSRRRLLTLGGKALGGLALLGATESLLAACGDTNDGGQASSGSGSGTSLGAGSNESVTGGTNAPPSGATSNSSAGDSTTSTGSGPATSIDMTGVRSSATSWLWAPVDVAESQGFFAKHGINYSHVATGNGENAPVVLGGGADILLSTPASAMKAQIQKQELTVFAIIVTTFASNVVMSDKAWKKIGLSNDSTNVEKANALKGMSLGITGPGGAPDQLFRYILTNIANPPLDPDQDVKLVPVQGGGGGLLAAMKNGQIDAFCLSSPTSDQAVSQLGAHYLFNMSENPIPAIENYPYISCSAMRSYMDKNPDALERYCRALVDATNFIEKSPKKFEMYERKHFETLDDDTFQKAFSANRGIYATNIVPTKAQFEMNKQFLKIALKAQHANADAADALTFDQCFEPKYAMSAEK